MAEESPQQKITFIEYVSRVIGQLQEMEKLRQSAQDQANAGVNPNNLTDVALAKHNFDHVARPLIPTAEAFEIDSSGLDQLIRTGNPIFIEPAFRVLRQLQGAALRKQTMNQTGIIDTHNSDANMAMPNPDTLESTITDAIGDGKLTGEEIAKKVNAQFNSHFKATLSSLRKRCIIENLSPGYRLTTAYLTKVRTKVRTDKS